MRGKTSQPGNPGRTSLLLHLVILLMLCQLVLWLITQPLNDTSARGFVVSTPNEPATGTAVLPYRPQRHDRPTAFFAVDNSRFYNPGLAMAAEGLDAKSRYFVAMALEDCYALSHDGLARFRDDFVRRLSTDANPAALFDNWARERAFNSSIRDCVAFDRAPISPDYVLGLLKSAASDGDPRAVARTLLFRDLAESKVGTFDLVTSLLASSDPHVIRDVGLFLTRGESTLKLSDDSVPVRATTLAVAWELVACEFGLDCGSDSKLVNNLCAYQGQCGAFSYEDWLSRYTESAEEFAEILRLRMLLRQGLIMQDWSRLGLSGLKREMPSMQ